MFLEGGKGEAAAEGGEASKTTSGVNQFWLIALKNCEIFADVIKVRYAPFSMHTHVHSNSSTLVSYICRHAVWYCDLECACTSHVHAYSLGGRGGRTRYNYTGNVHSCRGEGGGRKICS